MLPHCCLNLLSFSWMQLLLHPLLLFALWAIQVAGLKLLELSRVEANLILFLEWCTLLLRFIDNISISEINVQVHWRCVGLQHCVLSLHGCQISLQSRLGLFSPCRVSVPLPRACSLRLELSVAIQSFHLPPNKFCKCQRDFK